jgi:hypothetical protein
MQDSIHRPRHEYKIGNIMPNKHEIRITSQVIQVFMAAGDEIIHPYDLMAFL